MASCALLAKIFLIIFNVLLFLAGLVPLAFGILALVSKSILEEVITQVIKIPGTEKISDIIDIGQLLLSSATLFIALGAVVAIIGFIGCCGACCNVKCMLYLYLTLLIVIVLAEVAIVVIAVKFPDIFSKEAEKAMFQHLEKNFKKDCNITDTGVDCPQGAGALAWNTLQYELKCCGAKDYKDYKSFDWKRRNDYAKAPLTCCKSDGKKVYPPRKETTECYVSGTEETSYYQVGCFDAILHWVVSSAIAIGVLAGIGALQLILIALTIVQLRNIASKSSDKQLYR